MFERKCLEEENEKSIDFGEKLDKFVASFRIFEKKSDIREIFKGGFEPVRDIIIVYKMLWGM